MPQTASSPVSLPPDVAKYIAQLDANDEAARQVATGLTDAQLNWRASPGQSWSIAQCLEHLVLTNQPMVTLVRRVAAGAASAAARRRPISVGGWVNWMFLQFAEPPPKFHVKAVPGTEPPAGTGKLALDRFLAVQRELRAFATETADHDLNALKVPHPAIKRLTVSVAAALLLLAAHNRRHLWQAGRVRASNGFPNA